MEIIFFLILIAIVLKVIIFLIGRYIRLVEKCIELRELIKCVEKENYCTDERMNEIEELYSYIYDNISENKKYSFGHSIYKIKDVNKLYGVEEERKANEVEKEIKKLIIRVQEIRRKRMNLDFRRAP